MNRPTFSRPPESGTADEATSGTERLKWQTVTDPDRLSRVVEDALGDIELRLRAIEGRLPSEDEAKALRLILERDARVQWLWATARTWAVWIAAVAAGATIGIDTLKTVLKRLLA